MSSPTVIAVVLAAVTLLMLAFAASKIASVWTAPPTVRPLQKNDAPEPPDFLGVLGRDFRGSDPAARLASPGT